jgi:N-acetyltransferase
MRKPEPCTLETPLVRLEPMTADHASDIAQAARDGELWNLRVTSVPAPAEESAYVAAALKGRDDGHMLPFVVRDVASGKVIGSTRYHDIVPAVERLEIGYTWYGKSWQRSHVNTTCKLLLMTHAFETLGAKLVGWRTDNFNFASQRAIERLGARKDGVLRHHALRRDGTVRDTVMYSMAAGEWPEIKAQLQYLLARPR